MSRRWLQAPEARSIRSQPLSLACALALVLVAAGPAAVAEDCGSPAEGVVVCETDTDDRPDTVTVEAGEDGVGSAQVFVEDHTGNSFISRSVEASAATAEGSPAGAREANATAGAGASRRAIPATWATPRRGPTTSATGSSSGPTATS